MWTSKATCVIIVKLVFVYAYVRVCMYECILADMFIKAFLVTTCEKSKFNLFTFQLIHNVFFTNFIYHIGV